MKKLKYIVLFLSLFIICNAKVQASSGALKKVSIKTCPNGITYGYHGKDNHWHVAEPTSSWSGWTAVGEPLPGDPCPNNGSSTLNGNKNASDNTNNSSQKQEDNKSTRDNTTVQKEQEQSKDIKKEEEKKTEIKEEQTQMEETKQEESIQEEMIEDKEIDDNYQKQETQPDTEEIDKNSLSYKIGELIGYAIAIGTPICAYKYLKSKK